MFAVIARFPAAPEHRDTVLTSLDESLAITKLQPGFLAHQVLAPSKENDLRVCLMLWQDRKAFTTFLGSDASKEAHAGVRPDFFSETPAIEQFEVLDTWHAPSAVA